MVTETALLEMGWKLDNSYAELPDKFYTNINPTPVRAPKLIILNHTLATTLGLKVELLQKSGGVTREQKEYFDV